MCIFRRDTTGKVAYDFKIHGLRFEADVMTTKAFTRIAAIPVGTSSVALSPSGAVPAFSQRLFWAAALPDHLAQQIIQAARQLLAAPLLATAAASGGSRASSAMVRTSIAAADSRRPAERSGHSSHTGLAPAPRGTDEPDDDARPPGPHAIAPGSLSMEDLVREHGDAVYRVALSVTRDVSLAEDASQDALIKAWQALPSFRGDAPLRNWVLRITHNTAISLLRKRRDEFRDPNDLPDQISHRTVESQVQDRLAIDRFHEVLALLDPTSRSIVVLREIESLSYDEICDVLDLPMPTVKTRLLRARRQLAVALEGWQP